MRKRIKLAAAALFAAAIMTMPAPAMAAEITPLRADETAQVSGPAAIYIGAGGPGTEEHMTQAPEGTVQVCGGPGEAALASLGAIGWTDEDLYVLAHVICGEAQCYSDEEQRYIGSVVLNRRNSGRYPGTVKGVVFQPGQYSCTRDGNYYRTPTESNWANARWLLEHGSVLPPNVVFQSGGRQGRGVYLRTQYHYYCCLLYTSPSPRDTR